MKRMHMVCSSIQAEQGYKKYQNMQPTSLHSELVLNNV